MSDQRWCPSCEEWTVLVDRGICPWCDTPLDRKKRGGWTRPDLRGGKFTEAQLRALHRAHVEQGLSINRLAKRTSERVGYKSHHSAAVAISDGWKRLGLPARSRIEATRLASTKHGMAPKHGPRPGYGTYRRRVLRGEDDRPRCVGVKAQAPRKGSPCDRPATEGSDYCFVHDPLRALEVQAITARMRRRQPRVEMLPMPPFAAWLRELGQEHGSLSAATRALGLSRAAYRYAAGRDTAGRPKAQIARRTVEAWVEQAGTTVEAIYGTEREAVAA